MALDSWLKEEARFAKEASEQIGKLVIALNDFNQNYTADKTIKEETQRITQYLINAQKRYERTAESPLSSIL